MDDISEISKKVPWKSVYLRHLVHKILTESYILRRTVNGEN